MIRLLLDLAVTHIAGRGRQTVVSILGVALGVGFSIAMAALMQGSQEDFVRTLIDALPHVSIEANTSEPTPQPASNAYDLVAYSGLRPVDDRRGIRDPLAAVAALRSWVPGEVASSLTLQAVARYGGGDVGVSLIGVVPDEEVRVSKIEEDMREGSLADLDGVSFGIVLGSGVRDRLGAELGSLVQVSASTGLSRSFQITGFFHTGVTSQDDGMAYVTLRSARILAGQPTAVNQIRIRLRDADEAPTVAARAQETLQIEAKSWQKANESLLEAFFIRNVIMFTVVGAILLVAGFGIFNIVSTITHEKARDIAILKSLGFAAADMRRLFLLEGLAMGLAGSLLGWALGFGLTSALGLITIEFPGSEAPKALPVVVDLRHYALASLFALVSAGVAGYLPARRAARLNPVDIIRGAT